MKNLLTALDIGQSKISVIISAVKENQKLEILGIGETLSKGFEKGRIINMPKAVDSVRRALQEAEENAKLKAKNIFVGISGAFISSKNIVSKHSISDKGKKERVITKSDIQQVINKAKNEMRDILREEKYEIIHAIPQYYYFGNSKNYNKRIDNPLNMTANTLNAYVHIIYGDSDEIAHLKRCISQVTKELKKIVVKPVATAKAIMKDNEQKVGSILFDIGAGTVEMILFFGGSIRYSYIFVDGGHQITEDLSLGLSILEEEAEKIKIQNGILAENEFTQRDSITCKSYGGNKEKECKVFIVNEIIKDTIKANYAKIYDRLLDNELFDFVTAGIILTGGTALMKNIKIVTEQMFNKPVRIGHPNLNLIENSDMKLKSPKYATVVGLLYYGLDNMELKDKLSQKTKSINYQSFFKNMKEFITKIKDYT